MLTILVACTIFFAVGTAAMWSAADNASTSSAAETARWFTIGLIMTAGSTAVAWFTLID